MFSRVFSFFGEPFSDQCADVWRVLQSALEITSIVCTKTISVNILGYLKDLVKNHLELFKSCFNENITPKQHYLVHSLSQILMFGPPVRVWAMRFEAKHQYFKHIPWITKNFKNLPKTLSERHQSGVRADTIPLAMDDDASDHPLFWNELTCRNGKVLDGDKLNELLQTIKTFYPCFKLADSSGVVGGVYQASSITLHGTLYKVDSNTVLLSEIRDSTPIFGSVSSIWFYQTRLFCP